MVRATLRHLSALTLRVPTPNNNRTESKVFNTLDLVYGYALPNGRSDLTLAIANATDEDDPLAHGAQRRRSAVSTRCAAGSIVSASTGGSKRCRGSLELDVHFEIGPMSLAMNPPD